MAAAAAGGGGGGVPARGSAEESAMVARMAEESEALQRQARSHSRLDLAPMRSRADLDDLASISR